VRGKLRQITAVDPALLDAPLASLGDDQLEMLIRLGRAHELRLHRFKRTMGLARVAKVLGALKGINPAELLDIGSGRGAFVWPLLDAFPWLPVTTLDTLDYRVADLQAVHEVGLYRYRQYTATRHSCRSTIANSMSSRCWKYSSTFLILKPHSKRSAAWHVVSSCCRCRRSPTITPSTSTCSTRHSWKHCSAARASRG
jgi:hypothetical protein